MLCGLVSPKRLRAPSRRAFVVGFGGALVAAKPAFAAVEPSVSIDAVPGVEKLIARVRVLCESGNGKDGDIDAGTLASLQDATLGALKEVLEPRVLQAVLQESGDRAARLEADFTGPGCQEGMSPTDRLNLFSFSVFRTLNTNEAMASKAQRKRLLMAIGRSLLAEGGALHDRAQDSSLRAVKGAVPPSVLRVELEELLARANDLGLVSAFGLCEAPRDRRRGAKGAQGSKFPGIEDDFCLDDELAATPDFRGDTSANLVMDGLAYRRAMLRLASDSKFLWPDFIGCAIMSLARDAGYDASADSYFSDTVFNANPDEYDPIQTVQTWTFARRDA